MGLVLVDLDRVLVMNAEGGECRRGQAVFRASPTLSEGSLAPTPGTRFVVLTHRNRAAAAELLRAAGLAPGIELVAAEELLRESVRTFLREMRFDGLAKSTALPLLRRRHGWENASTTVLVDDRRFNCVSMIEAGAVQWGIEVPSAEPRPDGRIAVFDLATALRWATALAAHGLSSVGSPAGPPGPGTPLPPPAGFMGRARGVLWTAPRSVCRLEDLATGRILQDRSLDAVSLLRTTKQTLNAVLGPDRRMRR